MVVFVENVDFGERGRRAQFCVNLSHITMHMATRQLDAHSAQGLLAEM